MSLIVIPVYSLSLLSCPWRRQLSHNCTGSYRLYIRQSCHIQGRNKGDTLYVTRTLQWTFVKQRCYCRTEGCFYHMIHRGHYTYHPFNIQQTYVLPTQCIYVFCVDLRTYSDYFTVQQWLVGFCNWDGVCLLRGTFYILRSAHTVYLCVLCASENKQRLFHFTALTGWFL